MTQSFFERAKLRASLACGWAVGHLLHGLVLGVALLLRQTISIIFAVAIITILLHQQFLHWRTLLAGLLCTVPLDVRARLSERAERRRRQAVEQDAHERIALRLDRQAVRIWNNRKKP